MMWAFIILLISVVRSVQVPLDLELFQPAGSENCGTLGGAVVDNTEILSDECKTIDLVVFGNPVSISMTPTCIEPGRAHVAFHNHCGDNRVITGETTFAYGTCTLLPSSLFGLYGRAIWSGWCIDSSVSTSTAPTFTPSISPSLSAPSRSPSAMPTSSSPTQNPSTGPTSMPTSSNPSSMPTSSNPSTCPTVSPTSTCPTVSPTRAPTSPTQYPTNPPTTAVEEIYVKLEVTGSSCNDAAKGDVSKATARALELDSGLVAVWCDETAFNGTHWVTIKSNVGTYRVAIASQNFLTDLNAELGSDGVVVASSLQVSIPTTTQSPLQIVPVQEDDFDTGVVAMCVAIVFILGAWLLIHGVIFWKFAFYNSTRLIRWESLTWTIFLAHAFDFCSDAFLCYETSQIFGSDSWPFIVSVASLCVAIFVNFIHLINFLNFAFKNPDTKHWLLKDNGLQMIVFVFVLCGGNPSFMGVLVSMVIINRVPLTAMEITHFSSHRWTVVIMENIPQLIVGIWTLPESKNIAQVIVVMSIAFSAISSVSVLIISWYQNHNHLVPVRMEVEMNNMPRLKRIHFIPLEKLLERTHEGASIEVYSILQTDGHLSIQFAVYEVNATKYKKSKRNAIAQFASLFRDQSNWLHKKDDVDHLTKVRGKARTVRPPNSMERLRDTIDIAPGTGTSENQGEAPNSPDSPTVFDIRGTSRSPLGVEGASTVSIEFGESGLQSTTSDSRQPGLHSTTSGSRHSTDSVQEVWNSPDGGGLFEDEGIAMTQIVEDTSNVIEVHEST